MLLLLFLSVSGVVIGWSEFIRGLQGLGGGSGGGLGRGGRWAEKEGWFLRNWATSRGLCHRSSGVSGVGWVGQEKRWSTESSVDRQRGQRLVGETLMRKR